MRDGQIIELSETGGRSERAERSSRFPEFIGQRHAAGALNALAVAVVGLGSVGGPAALHLARVGAGMLMLVDPGRYKAQSVLTHAAIGPEQVGMGKARHIGGMCKAINPAGRVMVSEQPLEELGKAALFDVDVVIVATDNLRVEVEAGIRCFELGIPMIRASVHGATLVAQVLFHGTGDNSPCPLCLYSAEELASLNAHTIFSCEGARTGQRIVRQIVQPTRSVPMLCNLAGDLAAIAVLRHALGLGPSQADILTEWSGYAARATTTKLTRRADCPFDHIRWTRCEAPRALAHCTLAELAQAAGAAIDEVSFDVGGMFYAERGACGCGVDRPLNRLVRGREAQGRCEACGQAILPHPFHMHRPIPAELIRPARDKAIGAWAGPATWVLLKGEHGAWLFREKRIASEET